jgi:hypothetical protein
MHTRTAYHVQHMTRSLILPAPRCSKNAGQAIWLL